MIVGQVHIDKPLSNFAYYCSPRGTIADALCPIVPVEKQSDLWFEFNKSEMWRTADTLRAPGDVPNTVRFYVGSKSYYAPNYELMGFVTEEELANADDVLRTKLENRVGRVRLALDIDRERRCAAAMIASAGSNAAVASVWTGAGANPVGDIYTGIENVEHGTGYRPNRLVFGLKPWNAFRKHTVVIDKAVNPNVTGGAGLVTVEQAQSIFSTPGSPARILVGELFMDNNQEGDPVASITPVWTNHCFIYRVSDGPSTEEPTFMAQLRWTRVPGAMMEVVRHPPDRKRKIQELQIGYYQAEVFPSSDLCMLLRSATTN